MASWRRMCLMALLFCMAFSIRAEMGDDEYRSSGSLRAPGARARVERELETARRLELEEERQAEQRQAAERMERQQKLLQRPMGAQLLDGRCNSCHSAAIVQQADRGVWGWRWTVERMRWWHGANLQAGEAAILAAFLAQTQGSGESQRYEDRWLSGLGITAVALLAWKVWRRWHRNRKSSSKV